MNKKLFGILNKLTSFDKISIIIAIILYFPFILLKYHGSYDLFYKIGYPIFLIFAIYVTVRRRNQA